MRTFLLALLFVPTVLFANSLEAVPGTATNTMYVIQNQEGKKIITNVKPFPEGYVVIKEYPINIKSPDVEIKKTPVDSNK